jgi:hypothetical protein
LTSRSKQPKILAKVKQKMLRISSHAWPTPNYKQPRGGEDKWFQKMSKSHGLLQK